jgi:hypothetical protein
MPLSRAAPSILVVVCTRYEALQQTTKQTNPHTTHLTDSFVVCCRTLSCLAVLPCSRTLVVVFSETLSEPSTTASSAVRSSAVVSSRPPHQRSRSFRITCNAMPFGSEEACWLLRYVATQYSLSLSLSHLSLSLSLSLLSRKLLILTVLFQ